MTRDIDISLIRTFVAVVESGGMTAAAHALNLTQGAVSQKIKRLEALFDSQLIERNSRAISLTPQGERLLARANRMISLNDEIWQLMTKPDFTGEIRLGVPLDIIRPMMPPIMKRFSREYPNIQLTLVSDMTGHLLEALKKGDIDLTLTTEYSPGREGELLISDRLVWIGAEHGEACHQSPLPVSFGPKLCAFRGRALEALNKAEINWQAICSVGNVDSIMATVEADMSVAPYMACLVPDNVRVIDPTIGLPELPTYHINLRMPEGGGSDIARELARYIRQGVKAL